MLIEGDEVEVVRLCLHRCRDELSEQIDGKGIYRQVSGSAWRASRHLREKIVALLARIENERGPR